MTHKGGFLYGRVHKGEPLPLPKEVTGWRLSSIRRSWIWTRALVNAQVRLSGFPGAGLFTTDGDGFLKVPLPAGMQPTTVSVMVQLEMSNYPAASATTMLQIWGATCRWA